MLRFFKSIPFIRHFFGSAKDIPMNIIEGPIATFNQESFQRDFYQKAYEVLQEENAPAYEVGSLNDPENEIIYIDDTGLKVVYNHKTGSYRFLSGNTWICANKLNAHHGGYQEGHKGITAEAAFVLAMHILEAEQASLGFDEGRRQAIFGAEVGLESISRTRRGIAS